MRRLLIRNASFDRWLVFGASALAFFFVNFATFASLGVVLFTMVKDLGWSMTAAGFSFSLLGLACGLSSTFPAWTMKRVGARGTMVIGMAMLATGCALASVAHSLLLFDIAIAVVGMGFTFSANIPGVILIAAWFERGSARVIGIYLMVGALGAGIAPPVVEAVVLEFGWRGHWRLTAIAAGLIGVVCLLLIRDRTAAKPLEKAAVGGPKTAPTAGWTPRQAALTPQFVVLTAALVLTMTAVTTINSIVVTHLVKLGATPSSAAWALGALGLTATLLKGVIGHFCETVPAKGFVVAGLLFQAAGCALLIFATSGMIALTAAILFGTGWAFALVAGWVVLLDFFGGATGARILAIVQLATTVGAAGPIGAGLIFDRTGTFAPIFVLYAAGLALLALPVLAMRRPAAPWQEGGAAVYPPDGIASAKTA